MFLGLVIVNQKKNKGKRQNLISAQTRNVESKIQTFANWKKDEILLSRIREVDFVAKEVKYHNCCRLQYERSANKTPMGLASTNPNRNPQNEKSSDQTGSWHDSRYVHSEAFSSITSFVHDLIVKKKQVHRMADINKQYKILLCEIGGHYYKSIEPTSQKLEEKLMKYFGDKLTISNSAGAKGNLLYSSELTVEEAINLENYERASNETKLRVVAFMLREAIFDQQKRKLPSSPTIEDIKLGECDIPEILNQFFTHLIAGPWKRSQTESKMRRIKSLSQDVIFAFTSGNTKPGKHLELGIAIKSMTGSKKIIQILNRFGHCASYSTIEEIETEMTFAANKDGHLLPYGMSTDSDLGTGVSWDNYDRFVNTLSGKDTLHDNVGICYQLKPELPVEPLLSEAEASERRRSEISEVNDIRFAENISLGENSTQDLPKKQKEEEHMTLNTYILNHTEKKTKMSHSKLLPVVDQRKSSIPDESIRVSKIKDFLWMAQLEVSIAKDVPMWIGWNATITPSSCLPV